MKPGNNHDTRILHRYPSLFKPQRVTLSFRSQAGLTSSTKEGIQLPRDHGTSQISHRPHRSHQRDAKDPDPPPLTQASTHRLKTLAVLRTKDPMIRWLTCRQPKALNHTDPLKTGPMRLTSTTNHLPPERFASKKSPGGLDYVPALFTPEEEHALGILFETRQPTWDTSMNRHLKHYGSTMGGNRSDVERTTDVPPEFEPYIERMVNQLASRGISLEVPNQVKLARYESGAGIGDHIDAELLEKYVLGLNLKCPVPMHL